MSILFPRNPVDVHFKELYLSKEVFLNSNVLRHNTDQDVRFSFDYAVTTHMHMHAICTQHSVQAYFLVHQVVNIIQKYNIS